MKQYAAYMRGTTYMPLVIVESPAKCSKIQGFLGAGYRVIASMGHIRALVQDVDSIGIGRNFEPTYEFMKEKSKAIAQIKAAAKDCSPVILCSDDDREGEAIAYSIALLLKLDPRTNPRATFREITKNAVVDAVAKPRTIDMNKVNSQQARAMLDMMVGFTISPLLWKHVGGSLALSAGRCQTPALRLVCEREAVIEKFKSDISWLIQGTWSAAGGIIDTRSGGWPATMTEALSDEESALNYLENHSGEPGGKVRSAETKPWTESPPQPLMTSTLQQQSSNLYHCPPKRTMQIAQKLYEAGHITYMRTDQTTMSEEALEDARKVVAAKWGKEYLGPQTKTTKTVQKKPGSGTGSGSTNQVQAQEAHEAIRPTHFDMSKLPEDEDWGVQDYKIYRLIWLRAIQSTMAQAKGETREIQFDAEGDEGELPWQAKWRRTVFPGWKAADEKDTSVQVAQNGDDPVEETVKEQEGDSSWKIAESLKAGQLLRWHSLKGQPKESKPQGRYTEATLVRDLEKRGIGRPSTFASLIATINEKAYTEVQDIPASVVESRVHSLAKVGQWPPAVEKFPLKRGGEKARMVPTPLGKSVMEFALKHFPDIFAFDFTAGMESRLDKVAEGKENWKLVLGDTWNSYKDRVSELKAGASSAGASNGRRREFGDGLIGVVTAKGPLLLKEGATKEETVFYGWPTSTPKKGLADLTDDEAKAFVLSVVTQKQGDAIGEWNGHPIIKKKGPYGFYAECNGVKVNLGAEDELEAIIVKIRAKQENPTRTVGPFQIKIGPYGPYLMRSASGPSSGKQKPQYVSIPKETNIDELTAQQAGEIFEAGLKAKAAFKGKRFKK
jgi:DNA topoisomerase I